ncbi:flavodoxin [Vibrio coralliilyticus]|uniref:flavodoxin n=1 Tax=Vibrio coralliilyticus TaxID=190893 RepID=UPI0015613D42|nr:flavodoxin [Vibrio coralliilyticus]NRF26941.1 flavodoxin [Vibrio coralliilyticus]NRF81211.1 flavodoxin [Vibrio coralliilyticus]
MSNSAISIVETKNQWLSQHIDVEFPTKESLAGRQLYMAKSQDSQFETLVSLPEPSTAFSEQDIFKVDFHRLTVMFSLLQSKRWEEQNEQELIVEFLSQIIFSEPCDLYVGFQNGEPTAAAIVTKLDDSLLISDVISTLGEHSAFVSSLVNHASVESSLYSYIYIES